MKEETQMMPTRTELQRKAVADTARSFLTEARDLPAHEIEYKRLCRNAARTIIGQAQRRYARPRNA
jgi:hypothetical protein